MGDALPPATRESGERTSWREPPQNRSRWPHTCAPARLQLPCRHAALNSQPRLISTASILADQELKDRVRTAALISPIPSCNQNVEPAQAQARESGCYTRHRRSRSQVRRQSHSCRPASSTERYFFGVLALPTLHAHSLPLAMRVSTLGRWSADCVHLPNLFAHRDKP